MIGKELAGNALIRYASAALILLCSTAMAADMGKVKAPASELGSAQQTLADSARAPVSGKAKDFAESAQTAYRSENYQSAIEWGQRHFEEGGSDMNVRSLISRSYYAIADYKNAARSLHTEYEQSEKLAKFPSEDALKLLVRCYVQFNDVSGQSWALERLVTYYPRKEHWNELIALTQKRGDFGADLAMDVWRLKLATDTLNGPAEYQKAVNLALQLGFMAEAKQMVDKGFADASLGVGADANEHKKLRVMVSQQLAQERRRMVAGELPAAAAAKPNGNSLVNAGLSMVTMGELDKGFELIKRGLAEPNAQRPQYDRLHQGIATLLAGRKAQAVTLFKTISGRHGAADLGRLWYIYALQLR